MARVIETHELPATAADELSNSHGPRPGEYDGGMHDKHDGSVFVDSSGRRGRLVRPIAIAAGAACVLFIVVVVGGGLFNSGAGQGRAREAEDRAEPSTPPTSHHAGLHHHRTGAREFR
ncbi:hypothetical protein [Streptomyces mirabilis]|uniref:hypothetical protein n=1 Tax=Streptomyces mirabilis TaxID=68239 RepID=UPI00368D5B7D